MAFNKPLNVFVNTPAYYHANPRCGRQVEGASHTLHAFAFGTPPETKDAIKMPVESAMKPHNTPAIYNQLHSSTQIDRGASIAIVGSQLRHSDPRITLGLYAHVVRQSQRDAIEGLASAISWGQLLTDARIADSA